MAVNTTVKTTAEVGTDLAVTQYNPTANGVPPGVNGQTGNKKIVHVTLEVDGVDVTMASLHAALEAAYPVVSSNKSTQAYGCYIFNIGPS